jgi:hypothetical protein
LLIKVSAVALEDNAALFGKDISECVLDISSQMKDCRYQMIRPAYSSFCKMPFIRFRLPPIVDAFHAPPRGPAIPFLFSATAMSRGDLAAR